MFHHFLQHHAFGESSIHIHADNCSGQNKNRFMMQYLMWRVHVGLNMEIKMSFLLVGHTKFAPDCCFGLFKRLFRKTKVGCLEDIAAVVERSAAINHAQLVGTHGYYPCAILQLERVFWIPHVTNSTEGNITKAAFSFLSIASRSSVCEKFLQWSRKKNQVAENTLAANISRHAQHYTATWINTGAAVVPFQQD